MFDRFTDKARTVLINARKEVDDTSSTMIETPQLLLALMVTDSPASDVLSSKGFTQHSIRAQLDRHLKKGFKEGSRTSLPFSLHAKKVLEAADEAASGGEVTTLHLLWGILEPECSACNAQQSFGSKDVQALRQAVKGRLAMGHVFGDSRREWDVSPPLRDAVYLRDIELKSREELEKAFLSSSSKLKDREGLLILLANSHTKIQILERLIVKASQQADLGDLPRLTNILTNLEKNDVGKD